MKDRLVQLLDIEKLSPSKFADIIGVQRSSISHVLSGRNKPSFDFLQKTLKAFPGLNADWLIQGEGTMYEHMGRETPGTLFDVPEGPHEIPVPDDIQKQSKEIDQIEDPELDTKDLIQADDTVVSPQNDLKRKIVQVMVFYDNDTFRSYGPSQ
ncbi:MAG: helix-turn-helix transcriptional regulator [Bacteroidales bacterium]|nr:helix-turn-helix transcriptional regulator [Bacteroidales bacterium]